MGMFKGHLFAYFILINTISVILTVIDKYRAKIGGRRIREKTLLRFAIFGGSAAMYITMRIIKHKTRHNKFMIGIPMIIIVQLIAVVLFYIKFF